MFFAFSLKVVKKEIRNISFFFFFYGFNINNNKEENTSFFFIYIHPFLSVLFINFQLFYILVFMNITRVLL